MSKIVTAAEIDIQLKGAGSLKSMRTEITHAKNEAILLSRTFGEFSPQAEDARKKAAALTKEMGDLGRQIKSQNTNNLTKMSDAAAGISSGFLAAQGAMNLLGMESDTAENALLKVQSAMALTQGLKGLGDAQKGLVEMAVLVKGKVVSAFKSLAGAARTFGAALGIGLILIAVAALVTYWEDIVKLLGFGATEQEKQANAAKDSAAAAQSALEATESSTNQLKLQGLSERDILDLKIAQTDEVIAKNAIAIAAQKALNKEEVEATKRNKERLKMVARVALEMSSSGLRLLAAPIDAVIFVINKASDLLGLGNAIDFNINDKISELNKSLSETAANLLFNPEDTEQAGKETITKMEAAQAKLLEKRAGFQVALQGIDKAAAAKSKAAREKEAAEAKRIQDEKDKKAADGLKIAQELADVANREKRVRETEAFTLRLEDLKAKFEVEKLLLESQNLETLTLLSNFEANKKQIEDDAEAARLADINAAADKKAQSEKAATDKSIAEFEKEWAAKELIQQNAFSAASQFSNLIGELGNENLKVQKAQALIQVGIDTASAISSLVRMSSANPANAVTGGVAGALQFASGILQITANIAKAVKILGATAPTPDPGDLPGDKEEATQPQQGGNTNQRVFVVETDITSSQTRVRNLTNVGVVY